MEDSSRSYWWCSQACAMLLDMSTQAALLYIRKIADPKGPFTREDGTRYRIEPVQVAA